MTRFHHLAVFCLAACVLAACGIPASVAPTSQVTSAPAPTSPATSAPAPTAAPQATTAAPTAAPLVPTSAPATQPQPTAPQPQPTAPAAGAGEVLFLRRGVLFAVDVGSRAEREIADNVSDFAATPDGQRLALIRGTGRNAELWTVQRDGSGLTQLTSNNRAEATPAWSPDGVALVVASAATDQPYVREWFGWSQWCSQSEVRLLDLRSSTESSLGRGCDPAFSPDGQRIAFAGPPAEVEQGFGANAPLIVNSIRLVNRKGENGWNFAQALGPAAAEPNDGRLVYAPAWSPGGEQIVYQRFLGYQALVDISLSEVAGSFQGNGQSLNSGAGWLLPARFAPGGQSVAISENNFSDARGFGGYDNWSVTVLQLEGSRQVAMPSGPMTMVGQQRDLLQRAQVAVWAPEGGVMAVQLPPGWRPDLPANEPFGDGQETAGEVWLWRPGAPPDQRLVAEVDFASPLLWLPSAA